MNIKQIRYLLVILGLVSLLFSRLVFVFINDPEGPNLLIVIVLALVIYAFLLGGLYLFQKTKRK